MVGDIVQRARDKAELHVAQLGRRWLHVQAVGRLAERIASAYGEDGETLVAAALLHDIGYAPELARTGFHPLDGARELRRVGLDQIARLVAHHSGARLEADIRGIRGYEDEFPYGATALDDALTFCDLSTSPAGEHVSVEDRIDEIVERYGAGASTAQAILMGRKDFLRARDTTLERVRAAGVVI